MHKVAEINKDIETIYISSDEEEEVQLVEEFLCGWGWSKEVTAAIGNWRKPQTLHVPSWIVQEALHDKTRIILDSADNGCTYPCSITRPPERGMFVRYIVDGWYSYLEDMKPRIGDKLHFMVSKSMKRLMVKLTRRENRR
ncbi:hypothetical protein L195_g051655 [Trifolium pratense]|nr:hypothetical protein L195_g051655 [Trifolium pratense]